MLQQNKPVIEYDNIRCVKESVSFYFGCSTEFDFRTSVFYIIRNLNDLLKDLRPKIFALA